jgi:hypothetical protein
MKTEDLRTIVLLSLGLFVAGCDKESNNPSSLSGKVVFASECKNNLKAASMALNIPDSLSCVDYTFDEANKNLSLRHCNAGFNCCPGKISCSVTLQNDTILIRESESTSMCDCNCLFDLDIEITGVEVNAYQVRIMEPYAGDQEQLLIGIDLEKNKEGSFCVTRKQYPWD